MVMDKVMTLISNKCIEYNFIHNDVFFSGTRSLYYISGNRSRISLLVNKSRIRLLT